MFRDFRKNRLFHRRTVILSGAKASLTALLVGRLGYLQLFAYEEYAAKSDNNRISPVINPALRGLILDRNGINLVNNIQSYRLLLYLENKSNVKNTLEKLSQILGLSERTNTIIAKRVENARRKSIISLIDSLSWDDLARVEANYHKLPGISIVSGVMRQYPFPYETAHFVGYVSLPSESEIEPKNQALFMHPDFRIGKSGVEKSFDQYLRGKYGMKYVEVNAYGIPIRTLSTKEGSEGSTLTLTIDLRLQQYVADRIKNDVASVVVTDVKSGEIISIASSPSFDQNNFVEGVSQKYWDELINDPRKPLNTKAISAIYPPGSVFKVIVALAALENGINPKKKIKCTGSYRLGKRVFHCWKKEGHGSLDMVEAITHSCNTYFFATSKAIGIESITEMAQRFGYGELFNVSLNGSTRGVVPSDEWKRKRLKERWVGGDTLNSSIGQGFVLATPLQMAVVTSRIANGGIPIEPSLVKSKKNTTQYDKLKDKPLVKKEHLDLIVQGMIQVVNKEGGTAYYRRIRNKGYEMAGKTGTSQVISKRENEMTDAENDANKNHAIFVGFAPVHDPKYAISIVVEHGGSGSAAAAPIGRDVLLKAQKLLTEDQQKA